MNYKAIVRYLSLVLKLETLFMTPALLLSAYDGSAGAVRGFGATMIIMMTAALLIDVWNRGKKKFYARESFLAVAVCWVFMSLFGALPFWISGEIPSLTDALFESISGFSTTGATILGNVEGCSRGILFWRSLTHWVGGMGVLVLLTAVSSLTGGDENINVMRAESSGPAPGKLVPRLRQSSKILYGIYIGLTLALLVFLLAGGMPVYDSVVNTLATAGTGGFSVRNLSIEAYGSVYAEVVLTVFMLLFGVNFNVYFFLLLRNFRGAAKNTELRWYLGIVGGATAVVTANLLLQRIYDTPGQALRYAAFQVATVISSCGFSTADYSQWPQLSKMVLFLLAVTGACAGSTSGGLKVSRIVILLKEFRRALFRMAHPRAVEVVRMDGKTLDRRVVHGVLVYLATFALLFAAALLLVALDNFDLETTLTAVLACINNIGPGYGMVSPAGSFAGFSHLSKWVLSLCMLMGRLEIYPILLLLAPRTWRSV